MSSDYYGEARADFKWDYLEPLSIYERGLVITAIAALSGEDAMPRLTDGAVEALGKMCPEWDFWPYVDRGGYSEAMV